MAEKSKTNGFRMTTGEGLRNLLQRLDSTAPLDVSHPLRAEGDIYHLHPSCGVEAGQATVFNLVVVNILYTIRQGVVCPLCWDLFDRSNPAITILSSMYQLCRLEALLAADRGPAVSVIAASEALHVLGEVRSPAIRTWASKVRREAERLYDESLPEATSTAAKEVARKLAPASEGGGERLLALPHRHLAKLHEATGAVAYHLAAKGGHHLLQVPSSIVVTAEEQQRTTFNTGLILCTRDFQDVAACEDPDLLSRIVEMWDPNDPFFGNLTKLTEMAGLIR